jgi:hypothetical protein
VCPDRSGASRVQQAESIKSQSLEMRANESRRTYTRERTKSGDGDDARRDFSLGLTGFKF